MDGSNLERQLAFLLSKGITHQKQKIQFQYYLYLIHSMKRIVLKHVKNTNYEAHM